MRSLFVTPLGQIGANGKRKTACDTNMWESCQLPVPTRMIVTGFRCIFLEANGDWVPLNDKIYWRSNLRFCVSKKIYYQALVGILADPMLFFSEDGWRSLSMLQRRKFLEGSNHLTSQDRISKSLILNAEGLRIDPPEIDGVMIEQQQPFGVQIETDDAQPDRKILCVLDGIQYRAVL